jgi:hypothetical protein
MIVIHGIMLMGKMLFLWDVNLHQLWKYVEKKIKWKWCDSFYRFNDNRCLGWFFFECVCNGMKYKRFNAYCICQTWKLWSVVFIGIERSCFLTSFCCYDCLPFCFSHMMYVYEPEECGSVFPHYFIIVYRGKKKKILSVSRTMHWFVVTLIDWLFFEKTNILLSKKRN